MIAHLTDPVLARAIVRSLPILPGQAVCEPHVGDAAFVRALAECRPDLRLHVEVGDLNPDATGLVLGPEVTDRLGSFRAYRGINFLTQKPYRPADWILENPPYGDETTRDEAEPHIRRSFEVVRPGGNVVALLQNGFLFGTGRFERLWRPGSGVPRPFKVWGLVGRPKFKVINPPPPPPGEEPKKRATNKYEYVVIWWNLAVPNPRTEFDWLDWKTLGA